MKTIEIELYQFNELNEESKQKAVENLYDLNVDHDWWQDTYEDAKSINLKITGFDLDRGQQHCTGKVIYSAMDTAKLIIENHGEICDTHILAKSFIKECKKYDEIEDLELDFENDLLNEYANLLQNEHDYLISEEAIIESIESNEYDFTVDGKLY